ncbi:hypothetical protein Sjap_013599 [Stephania japonica]|uniref:lipid IVA 3-deoxy-D-manno-octulosonic acid transferase n=1 Tax=Stephania japonica TaxID=461633 RepID=A0AAP0NXT8_9MAGN
MERVEKGKWAYMAYRAVTYSLSPFLYLHLQWRRLKGLEHPLRWPERLARPSLPRPPGPLLYFHAVSLGEGMAAIPLINHCTVQRPDLNVLMTTATNSAFDVIKDRLPNSVLYQFAPLDTPAAMDSFLGYWRPNAVILMESELWPNLILGASKKGIIVALLNARVSKKSFSRWSGTIAQSLLVLMLSKFSLIIPLSTLQAINFQLLHAPPFVINFVGDLKYGMPTHLINTVGPATDEAYANTFSATGETDDSEKTNAEIKDLQLQLSNRQVWMASSIHDGEEEVILEVHKDLLQKYPDLITIIVPRHPQQRKKISLALKREGLEAVFRSHEKKIMPSTNVYVTDTLGELRSLYRLTPIAVMGGSFIPGLAGHNFSEAAAAGCAILTGCHIGHFSHMVASMLRLNSMAVLQVSGSTELSEALEELFSNTDSLEARRAAAKQAARALSNGIVERVWNLIDLHVVRKAIGSEIGKRKCWRNPGWVTQVGHPGLTCTSMRIQLFACPTWVTPSFPI